MERHWGALQNLDGIRTKFGGDGPLSPASSRKMISRELTKLALSADDQPPIFPSDILMMRWFLVWKHSASAFDRYQGFLQPCL